MEEVNTFMELTVGAVLEGKVKSITNFGAFIALPENKTGMVHISEIANAYVSDIRQHLTEGQDVKVMVIAIDPAGKINLSIKRLEPKPQTAAPAARPNFRRENRDNREPQSSAPAAPKGNWNNTGRPAQPEKRAAAPVPPPAPKTADQLFEERLKAFMSESDSKLSSMRADHRTKSRRR